ncbi:hypothetical protein FOL47_002063 [Perkinsus chesapeaki]|uniref:N-acetyltransferase domain-containing protein n=1 Tax=Perkinsus chesapeaki TaxID=330153 RepID=A0A7J6MG47_PERCH|nr:hypothetical protein FOL47_002063 [Perkinsus chesapeaki]
MSEPMAASSAQQVLKQGGVTVGNREGSGMSSLHHPAKYYSLPGNQYSQEQLRNAVMLASQIVEQRQSPTGQGAKSGGGLEGSTSNSENSTSTGSVINGTNSEEGGKVVGKDKATPPVYSRAQAAMVRASQQQQQQQPNWVQTGLAFGGQGAAVLKPTWTTRSAGQRNTIVSEEKDSEVVVEAGPCTRSVSSTALMVARNLHPSIVEANEKLNTTYRVGDLVKIMHDERFGGEMRGVFEASVYEVRGTLLTVRYSGDNKGIYDETIDVLFHCKRVRKHGVLDRSKLRVVGSMTEPPPPESSGDSPISEYASMGAVESLPEDGNICGTDCTMTAALVESCLAVFGRTLPEFDRGYIPRMCRSARSRIHALVSLDEPDQALAALCHHLDPQLGFSELHFFSVDFTRQRQGLGSWLLKVWLSLLASSGVHYVITYASENAISWYEKHGFVHKRDMTLPERHIRGRVTLCTGAKLMELNLQDHPDQQPDIGKLRAKLKRLDHITRHQKKAQQQQRRLKQFSACAEAVTEAPSAMATATVDGKTGLMIQSVNEEAMLVKVNGNWYHINYGGLDIHIEDGSGMSQGDSVELSETSTEGRGVTPPPFDENDEEDSRDGVQVKRGLVRAAAGSPAKRRRVFLKFTV